MIYAAYVPWKSLPKTNVTSEYLRVFPFPNIFSGGLLLEFIISVSEPTIISLI